MRSYETVGVMNRVLRYGDLAGRREMADAIAEGNLELAELLARTARSEEDLTLRARCVEVLGLALAAASPSVQRTILAELVATPR